MFSPVRKKIEGFVFFHKSLDAVLGLCSLYFAFAGHKTTHEVSEGSMRHIRGL